MNTCLNVQGIEGFLVVSCLLGNFIVFENPIQKLGLPSWHLFKVNNRNTRKSCEICSKLTIKTLERRRSGFCYCWLWTYFTPFSSVSNVGFEQVNVSLTLENKYDKVLKGTLSYVTMLIRSVGNNGGSTVIDRQDLMYDRPKSFYYDQNDRWVFLRLKVKFLFNLDSVRFN